MSGTLESPWMEHEKVALLAEILRVEPGGSEMLLRLIRERQIQPRWDELLLPQGRSLKSCQRIFQDLINASSVQPQYSSSAPVSVPPMMQSLLPRQLPPVVDTATPRGRLIQPRPPGSLPAYFDTPTEPAKRKRGRPSNEELQARQEAAAARGEPYPPPKKPRSARGGKPAPLRQLQPGPSESSPTTTGAAPITPATESRNEGYEFSRDTSQQSFQSKAEEGIQSTASSISPRAQGEGQARAGASDDRQPIHHQQQPTSSQHISPQPRISSLITITEPESLPPPAPTATSTISQSQ